jgi:hypothetical protein
MSFIRAVPFLIDSSGQTLLDLALPLPRHPALALNIWMDNAAGHAHRKTLQPTEKYLAKML